MKRTRCGRSEVSGLKEDYPNRVDGVDKEMAR